MLLFRRLGAYGVSCRARAVTCATPPAPPAGSGWRFAPGPDVVRSNGSPAPGRAGRPGLGSLCNAAGDGTPRAHATQCGRPQRARKTWRSAAVRCARDPAMDDDTGDAPTLESGLPGPRGLVAGRYEVRSRLGRGASKEVYLAYDERLDRE